MKNRKATYIEWEDSISTTGNLWVERKHVERNQVDRCSTIGFVLKETKDLLTVVNSFDSQSNCVSGDMTIPKCAIRKRRIVTWKK